MSETKEDLGVSIKKCTEFIPSVHAETQMLLLDISGVLQKHNFESIKGSGIVVADSSTKNIDNPAGWCHKVVARSFGEGGRKGTSQHLVAVKAHFAPSFGIDQAVLVIGYARFEKPPDKDALAAAYEESNWMAAAYGDDTFKLDEVHQHAIICSGSSRRGHRSRRSPVRRARVGGRHRGRRSTERRWQRERSRR